MTRITTAKGNPIEETKAEFEYKVTPYTIVNYTSRVIFVKSVYNVTGDNKLKEYIIPSGEKADYEVDYEEEVKHLMRDKNDEVVKKQDFLNINFEGGALGIKGKQNLTLSFRCQPKKLELLYPQPLGWKLRGLCGLWSQV